MQRLSGVHPVVPTPFTETGALDEGALIRLLEYVADADVSGLWLGGAGAEFTNLTAKTRQQIMRICRRELGGRLDLVWGVGDCSLEKAKRRASEAIDLEMDAIHSVEPYFYALGTDELRGYFLELADFTQIPLVIYFHPGRWTKVTVGAPSPLRVLGELARHEKIVGVKYSCVDFRDFQRALFALRSSRFSVMTSAGRLMMASLAVGADGGVFHEAMVAPRQFVELYYAMRAGKLDRAEQLQRALAPLGDAMAQRDQAASKTALSMLGLCEPKMSPPHLPMNSTEAAGLRTILADLGLIDVVTESTI